MVKILIVDDELWIREGLKKQIPWTELNMEMVGAVGNGEAALELYQHADIILTDICMPVLDGIGLMKKIREAGAACEFIVMSGHAEFEYAQKAINLGAAAYLLKPIETGELCNALKRVSEKCRPQKKQQRIDEYMTRWLYGEYPESDFFLSANADEEYCIILMEKKETLSSYMEKEHQMLECSLEIIRNIQVGSESCIFSNLRRKGEIWIITKDHWDQKNLPLGWYQKIMVEHVNLSELKDTCNKVLYYSGLIGFSTENNGDFSQLVARKNVLEGFNKSVEQWLTFLEYSQITQAERWKKEFIAKLNNGTISLESVTDGCMLLIAMSEQRLNQQNGSLLDSYPTIDNLLQLSQAIHTLEDITLLLDNIAQEYRRCIEQQRQANMAVKLDIIIEYLKKNYMKINSLNEVADIFGLNAAYFSRIFKKRTGENFNYYLNMIRINSAIEYLSDTEMTILEIAHAIGFENENYFMRKFKEIKKCTPSEYRKMIEKMK